MVMESGTFLYPSFGRDIAASRSRLKHSPLTAFLTDLQPEPEEIILHAQAAVDVLHDQPDLHEPAHVGLSRQKFPAGTTGNLLDAVVKSAYWNRGMDFGHGTGRGMGYVMNVHEGPAKIIIEYAQLF